MVEPFTNVVDIEWSTDCSIKILHRDTLTYIFSFVVDDAEDLYALRFVNHAFSKAASAPLLWRKLVDQAEARWVYPLPEKWKEGVPLYTQFAQLTLRIRTYGKRYYREMNRNNLNKLRRKLKSDAFPKDDVHLKAYIHRLASSHKNENYLVHGNPYDFMFMLVNQDNYVPVCRRCFMRVSRTDRYTLMLHLDWILNDLYKIINSKDLINCLSIGSGVMYHPCQN
jgi:hypothetical protein